MPETGNAVMVVLHRMSDASLLSRSMIAYGICLPLAGLLGYLLATPDDLRNFFLVLTVLGVMSVPLLLRWHHFWLIAVWNTQAMVFVLPGKPHIGLVISGVSLVISVLQYIVNRNAKFISVPTITKPLLFMAMVVLVTAALTGGIGLSILGASTVGGKRYVWLLGAMMGYFALTAIRIPPQRAVFYVTLFFLSAVTVAIANLTSLIGPSAVYYIFLVFPPENLWMAPEDMVSGPTHIARLGGVAGAGAAIMTTMLAVYGVAGIFDLRRMWRVLVFGLAFVATLFGGFRSILIGLGLTCALVFWLEGLMRTRFLPMAVLFAIFVGTLTLPFADKLPLTIQRTVSFVPFIPISPQAEFDAQGSTDWRLEMWKSVLPEVPRYLLVGKGYSIDAEELETVGKSRTDEQARGAIVAGDYHNGPLSLVMPFGIAGVMAFLWLLGAGLKVLRCNYLYGDPALRRINTYLLAAFISKAVFFCVIFGSLFSDLVTFTGLLGMSVSLNGGMRKPAPKPKPAMVRFKMPRVRAQALAAS